jgi:hypothetical protein
MVAVETISTSVHSDRPAQSFGLQRVVQPEAISSIVDDLASIADRIIAQIPPLPELRLKTSHTAGLTPWETPKDSMTEVLGHPQP